MTERDQLIQGLRQFADFLEANPEAPAPWRPCLDVFCIDKDELARAAKAIGGKLEKDATESFFFLRKSFGSLRYEINVARDQVCEKVVVGTKTIPAQPERVLPAQPERVLPAQPETVEEITEWRCLEILK